jgi:hypothetical protein
MTQIADIAEIPEIKKIAEIKHSMAAHPAAPLVVLTINAVAIALIAYYYTPIIACKVLFIEITLLLSLLCIVIVLFNRLIQNELIHLEVLAMQGQDEAREILRQGRGAMHQIQMKMEETLHPHEEDTMHELFSNLIPMVQLFINKEKNLLRWGLFSWKVANNAIRLFNSRSK